MFKGNVNTDKLLKIERIKDKPEKFNKNELWVNNCDKNEKQKIKKKK